MTTASIQHSISSNLYSPSMSFANIIEYENNLENYSSVTDEVNDVQFYNTNTNTNNCKLNDKYMDTIIALKTTRDENTRLQEHINILMDENTDLNKLLQSDELKSKYMAVVKENEMLQLTNDNLRKENINLFADIQRLNNVSDTECRCSIQ